MRRPVLRVRQSAWRGIALVGLVVFSACGGSGDTPDESDPLAVEVGGGATTFQAIAPGAQVPIVCGPQGGQHIWVGLRVANSGTARVDLSVSISDPATGVRVCGQDLADAQLVVAGAWRQRAGIFCFVTDPAAVRGRTFVLAGTARSGDQRAEASLRVVPVTPPGSPCFL